MNCITGKLAGYRVSVVALGSLITGIGYASYVNTGKP